MIHPQGRLSLVEGIAAPVSDVVAATTIHYVPVLGVSVPVWGGVGFIDRDIGPGISHTLSPTYQPASVFGYDEFVFMDGSTLRLGNGPKWASQFARGIGAGSTKIELKNGIWTNKHDMALMWGPEACDTVIVPANQATYVGTFVVTTAGLVTSSRRCRNLFNAYNQVSLPLRYKGDGSSWQYSSIVWRAIANNLSNKVSVCCGLPTAIKLRSLVLASSSTAAKRIVGSAIGLNDTANPWTNSQYRVGYADNGPALAIPGGDFEDIVGMGFNQLYQLEFGGGADVQTWQLPSEYGLIGSAML